MPRHEILDNGYDLTINIKKWNIPQPVKYILKNLQKMKKEILNGLSDLDRMILKEN